MLRTQRYKYVVHNTGKRPEQLFDLWLDPGETRNLAYEAAANPALLQQRRLLGAELLRTGDPFRPA